MYLVVPRFETGATYLMNNVSVSVSKYMYSLQSIPLQLSNNTHCKMAPYLYYYYSTTTTTSLDINYEIWTAGFIQTLWSILYDLCRYNAIKMESVYIFSKSILSLQFTVG